VTDQQLVKLLGSKAKAERFEHTYTGLCKAAQSPDAHVGQLLKQLAPVLAKFAELQALSQPQLSAKSAEDLDRRIAAKELELAALKASQASQASQQNGGYVPPRTIV